ncbi:IclR family transcriptional regulator [Arthrobacter sp. efr-133-TYG-118]|uniref:IclR family transcriptional regulator n=1 Tax=Arthrobacter sp. efr-133-TYG-118 TaxID=3040279 RepID=UPI00254FA3FD|nr:IclR family transcriptional regulator [Arthrobacter sp. efr-133-TYG-118]
MVEKQKSDTASKSSAYRERNSTADKALDILALFTPDRLTVSAIDVAHELSVARSTAYRYLLTLGSAGYLEENPSGGFRLGLKVFELARLARASYGLSQLALPTLHVLAQQTGETALLTKRSGNRAVCLEKEEPNDQRMRVSYERGSAMSLNAGASAWVLLAWEEHETVKRLLLENPLTGFTEATLTTENSVYERLALIRSEGFAISRGELDPDAIGIAAPVRDDQQRVVAGISLVAAIRRVPDSRIGELVEKVRTAADQVSELLALTMQ